MIYSKWYRCASLNQYSEADWKPQGLPAKWCPEKVRYKVIGVEMKGMESSMKLVALGATQRRG